MNADGDPVFGNGKPIPKDRRWRDSKEGLPEVKVSLPDEKRG